MRLSHHTTALKSEKHIPKGVEGGYKSIWFNIAVYRQRLSASSSCCPARLCGKVHREPQCNAAVSEFDRVEATLDHPLYVQLMLAA